ncbi:MAG: hypothetical protein QOE05_1249 [Actinomycetota bacterium]|nr:hypothetical protein [Actinomycetota bacterium]
MTLPHASPADLIATLAGLLVAQTFLVGLMAVRLDASYDSAVARIRDTARRVNDSGEMSVDDVLADAADCRDAVRGEVSALATLVAVAGVSLLAVLVAQLGDGRRRGISFPPAAALTSHWSRWEPGATCVLVLMSATVGLAVVAVQRARTAAARLRHALETTGLASAAAARDYVERLGSGDPDPYLPDRARAALSDLYAAIPGWHGSAQLRGDLWAAVATQPAAMRLCRVDTTESLRRARADYAAALGLAGQPKPDLLLRDGEVALTQAGEVDGTARWALLVEAATRCDQALAQQPASASAALLLDDVVSQMLAEKRRFAAFGARPAAVPALLRQKLDAALQGALAQDAVDALALEAWARNVLAVELAKAAPGSGRSARLADALAPAGARLVGYLIDGAGRIRAAGSNVAVLEIVHELAPVIWAGQELCRAVPARRQRERVAGELFPFLGDRIAAEDLRAIARRGDLTEPDVVLARALSAYALLAAPNDPNAVAALRALFRSPVRLPEGRLPSVRRALRDGLPLAAAALPLAVVTR